MRRLITSLLIVLLLSAGTIHCVGSFALTRTWDRFINNLSNKWVNSVAFVLAVYFRFYLVVLLVDMIVLNSVEFWGGKNPVIFDEKGEHRKSMRRGDERVEFTYRKFGREMEIRAFKQGRATGRLLLKKKHKGVFHIRREGRWIPMSIHSEPRPGGHLLLARAEHRTIHSRSYSHEEYRALREAVRKAQSNRALAALPVASGSSGSL